MRARHSALTRVVWLVVSCAVLALSTGRGWAADLPFLHPLFGNHAVLQRDAVIPVWGWTTPAAAVKVTVADAAGKAVSEGEATADADGRWEVKLKAIEAGGPYKLTVTGPQQAESTDLLVGDVWVCSGQSNMDMGIGACANGAAEIAAANFPQIRLFMVGKRIALEPQRTCLGEWRVCSPETLGRDGWGGFSGAGYFFGRTLHQELKVPMGLIQSAWGGTVAEAWTSGEALQAMPDFLPAVEQLMKVVATQKAGAYDFDKDMAAWWQKNDPGSVATPSWADPALPVTDWKTMALPQNWEKAGLPDFDGIAWFRREVEVPAAWVGKDLVLSLGPIDDCDTTYVNGTAVGGQNQWNAPRVYPAPAKLWKAGPNVVAVRVLDTGGGGGVFGKPEDLRLTVKDDAQQAPLSLAGEWRYVASTPMAKLPPVPARMDNNANAVSVLYNGMIAPLVPAAIKGAIWYQGEANAGRAAQYRTLLPTLIKDWRARFSGGEFPFGIVQLAAWLPVAQEPVQAGWAELRESQMLTVKTLPNTGLAVATDIGDTADIHPKNKQDVGKRLALWMLGTVYKQKIVYSGPLYEGMKVEGNKIRVSFKYVGGGLVAKDGQPLKWFAIAGADKQFVKADAAIDGETVVVSSPQVAAPMAVRYAWANNPLGANLFNQDGLPAVSFRTDVE